MSNCCCDCCCQCCCEPREWVCIPEDGFNRYVRCPKREEEDKCKRHGCCKHE